jgi:hypothetical protein
LPQAIFAGAEENGGIQLGGPVNRVANPIALRHLRIADQSRLSIEECASDRRCSDVERENERRRARHKRFSFHLLVLSFKWERKARADSHSKLKT